MSTAVKRACDACHRRKVKCDGINPCRNCSSAQLGCTYNAIPQKKGPKGSRAKVISELRETQRQTSLSAKVQSRLNGVNSPPTTPSLAPNTGLLTQDLIKDAIEFFFANMYSSMPILHRQRLEQQAMYMETSLDTYCLLSALCALMMFQPGMTLPGVSNDPYGLDLNVPGANLISGTVLMEETIRVRKGYDYLESPTLNTMCTSYFLSSCYYAMEMHDKAWYHLREATTLALMIGLNREDTYVQFDNIEASRRRRLYWLLLATERAYALRFQRPLTLQATINSPTLADDPSDPLAHKLEGFLLLANLFRPFDDMLTNQWNKARSDCSQSYLGALDKQYRDAATNCMSTDAQFADAAKNTQWLKNLVWQISTASGSPNEMGYQYSMDVSNDVLSMASSFPSPTQSMNAANASLIEKLLNITANLTDVLPFQPASRVSYQVGPRESLTQILNFLAVVRNGDHRFMPLLLSKVHEVLPRLINPVLLNAPETAVPMPCVDLFDGFGNAGIAQPPCLPMENYDSKFSVPRIEEFKTEPSPSGSAGGSAPSSADLNSPYVSSPPMLTPGMEYPHGLQTDFAPMSDMVMSPLGHGPGSALNTPGGMNHQMSGMMGLNHAGIGQAANMMNGQNMDHSQAMLNMGTPLPANGMAVRQQPQRSNSFAMPPPPIRTVGDFQALQRANSDMSTMGSMGLELDFNTLPMR